MQVAEIDIVPLSSAIGAEVTGVDLRQPFDDAAFERIRDAWHCHCILLFRRQRLADEDQVRFAARFGELSRVLHRHGGHTDHPSVMLISNIRKDGKPIGALPDGEMFFHSDQCYVERPSMATLLYAIEVPRQGGNTLFANMYAAYEALSPGLQRVLGDLRAVHSSALADVSKTREDRINDAGFGEQREFCSEHPVVRTHPETGRKALYVNIAHTLRFAGWTEDESKPLLRFLFDHAVRPEFTCRFQWRVGSVAMWDNRCAMHNPINDYHGYTRTMHRITLAGDVPS